MPDGKLSSMGPGDPGSSSLMAACSMVVKRPLFLGRKLRMGMAGGGDFCKACNCGILVSKLGFLNGIFEGGGRGRVLDGLSRVEVAEGVGRVWFKREDGERTGSPMV